MQETTFNYRESGKLYYDSVVAKLKEPSTSLPNGFFVDNTRTCTMALHKILRPLDEEDKIDFVRRLDSAAIEGSNYVSLLSTYTRAVMMEVAKQGFHVKICNDKSVTLSIGTTSNWPHINEFLPAQAQRNLQYLPESHSILVAPLPALNLEKEQKDLPAKMFDVSHIDYIQTKYLSNASPQANLLFDSFPIPVD